jgi:hypothetical protein
MKKVQSYLAPIAEIWRMDADDILCVSGETDVNGQRDDYGDPIEQEW